MQGIVVFIVVFHLLLGQLGEVLVDEHIVVLLWKHSNEVLFFIHIDNLASKANELEVK